MRRLRATALVLWSLAGCAGVSPAPPVTAPAAPPATPPAAISTPAADPAPPAAAATRAMPAPPPSPEASRYVLVRAGAFFHTALPPAGQRARDAGATAAGGASEGKSAPQVAARFRLARVAGDWVELETIAAEPDDPHCQRPSPLFEGLALRLFVAATDLQPLTTHRVHATLEGGVVELEPGVPVVRHGERWTAFPDGNPLAVELPTDAVGTSYAPGPPRAIAVQESVLPPDVPIEIGKEKVTIHGYRAGAPFEASAGRDGNHAVYVQHATPEGDARLRVELETGCARYAGTVAATALHKAQPPATAVWSAAAGKRGRSRFAARAGAAVMSEDDKVVGRVVGELPIADETNPDRRRPCFDWPLGPRGATPESAFRFCVAAPDLIESPAFLSDQQVAVITPHTRRQVALRIDNHTQRPLAEIDTAVRAAARRRLFALGDVVLVPPGEDEGTSASRATRNGLGRYIVKIAVEETTGAQGEMSSRRIQTALVRGDATTEGHVIKTGQLQQFQSAGSAADEANALEEMLDGAMVAVAEALRQQEP